MHYIAKGMQQGCRVDPALRATRSASGGVEEQCKGRLVSVMLVCYPLCVFLQVH